MLALCSMLLVTYYASNYAGIIGLGLAKENFNEGHVLVNSSIKELQAATYPTCMHIASNFKKTNS